jgi:hypothetical protein
MQRFQRLPRIAVVVAVVVGALVVFGLASLAGQGTPPGQPVPRLKLLVSGEAFAGSLPHTFGVPLYDAVNDQGDYVFTGNSYALFLRRANDAAPVRLLQTGDEVPGVPHSRINNFTSVAINQLGVVFFRVEYFESDTTKGGLFTYDAAGFHKIAVASDVAPDCGGVVFGRNLGGMLNDAGDVLVTAPLTPLGKDRGTPSRNTLFLKPAAGGAIVRLVGPGAPAPGTGGTLDQISSVAFNNARVVVFRAAIVGGSGGFGLFMWSPQAGVQKIVATGDDDLRGGTFNASLTTSGTRLNNADQVAFVYNDALYVRSPTTGLAVALAKDLPMPPGPLAGLILLNVNGLNGFNDSGQAAVLGNVSGPTLLLYTPGSPIEVTAYRSQPAPGGSGGTFQAFSWVLMNAAGDVSFFASLAPPTSPLVGGVFVKRHGAAVTTLVRDGQPAPAGVGGTFSMPVSQSDSGYGRLLASSFCLESHLVGGIAEFGSFLVPFSDVSQVKTLVTTADPLPAGAAVILRDDFWMGGNGTFTGVMARLAGADKKGMWVHNAAIGATNRVVVDGDPAPAPLTGWITFSNSHNQLVNSNGEVVFPATVSGYTGTFLFHWSAAAGLSKIVGPGDVEISTQLAFSSCSLQALLVPPLTEDKVVFKCTLADGSFGIFVGWSGSPPAVIARTGLATPIGGLWSAFGHYYLNRAGQVTFHGTTTVGATSGLFVGAAGSMPVKLAAIGDPAPGGGTFSAFPRVSHAGVTARGEAVFFASVAGGAGGGLFVAAPGDPSPTVTPIALNGSAAPAGGTWAIPANSIDACLNAAGDVLFQAFLANGTADSGLFLRRASTGVVETVVLQGQTPPGLPGVFAAVLPTINGYPGESKALGPTGEAIFQNTVDLGDHAASGATFRYRGPGTLEKLIARTDPAPESGDGTVGYVGQGIGTGDTGLFFFRVVVADGTLNEGIYMIDTIPPTLTAAGDTLVLWPANGKLRTVRIAGIANDVGSGVASAGTFEVSDEYGEIEPRGTFGVGPTGSYSFTVPLEASRLGTDKDGRHYTVWVTVEDRGGNTASQSVTIVVPHDAGNK